MTPVTWSTYDGVRDDVAPWLREVPAEWRFEKAKWFLSYCKQLNDHGTIDNVLSLTLRGVVNNDPDNPEGLVPKDYRTYQVFEAGDLVFKLIDLENVRTSRVGLVHERGIMSSAYIRVVPSAQWNPRFLYYFYFHLYEAEVFNKIGSGVRSTLGQADLLDLPIPVIGRDIQDKIVGFLDEKCAKVDEAVRIKEEQIALLRERRQILIHEAVTRGLNPDAPMKDSGIDWIGEIPEQWEVKRFTKEVCVQEGPGIMAADFQDKGVPLVRISGVRTRVVTLEGCNYLEPAKVRRKWEHFLLKEGDLVISGSASTGLVAEVGKEAIGAVLYTGLMKLRIINSDVLSKSYLEFFLSSKAFDTQVDLLKAGSTISHYGPSHLGKMFIIVPPWDEQIEVATYCAGESERIESAIAIKNEQIAALREYKTTLINAAVTGKIKVA